MRGSYDGQVMWELRNQPDLLVLDYTMLDPIPAALTADKVAAFLEGKYFDKMPVLVVFDGNLVELEQQLGAATFARLREHSGEIVQFNGGRKSPLPRRR